MAERKLEKTHLERIKALQDKSNKNNYNLGFATKELHIAEKQLERAKEQQSQVLSEFEDLQRQEASLVSELKEYYGEGHIDVDRGVFVEETPQSLQDQSGS